MRRALSVFFGACLFEACGDVAPASLAELDGGTSPVGYDAVVIEPPEEPAPPMPPDTVDRPMPPVVTPWTCPTGWLTVTSTRASGASYCRPYAMPLDCPPGQAHRPGETACTPIGYGCPDGEFSDQLAGTGEIIYVHAGESLTEAIRTAPPGALIALAGATYAESVSVRADLTVFGACPERTHLSSSTVAGTLTNLTVDGNLLVEESVATLQGVVAERMRFRGEGGSAIVNDVDARRLEVGARASAIVTNSVVQDVSIEPGGFVLFTQTTITGNSDAGGQLNLQYSVTRGNVTIHGPVALVGTHFTSFEGGRLEVADRAQATIGNTLFEGAIGSAMDFSGSSGSVLEVVVRETRAAADQSGGRGLVVRDRAKVTLLRGVFERNLDFAATVEGTDSELSLRDVIVRDTRPNDVDPQRGIALGAEGGAQLEVERALLENNSAGVVVPTSGADLELSDVTITDNIGARDGGFGAGIAVFGGTGSLHRVSVDRSRFHGMLVSGASTEVEAFDLAIAHTLPQTSDAKYGRGLGVAGGAHFGAAGLSITASREAGLAVSDPGTRVELSSLSISDTLPRASDGEGGYGLLIAGGTSASIQRGVIERSTRVGVAVYSGGSLAFSDGSVRDTVADLDGDFGVGIAADSAQVTLTRVELLRNVHTALRIEGGGATLTASDLEIDDTLPRVFDQQLGAGLLIFGGAQASVERYRAEHNRVYALFVHGDGSVLEASDVIAEHTGLGTDGLYASGLFAGDDATAHLQRARFVDNVQVGVIAEGHAQIELEDVEVLDTRKACVPERADCLDQAAGVGVGVYGSASIRLERFALRRNAVAGAALADAGALDLKNGEVTDQPMGINVGVDGYDVSRLEPNVSYAGNARDYDSRGIPIPKAFGDIPSPLQ